MLTQAPKRGVTQPSGGPKRGGWTSSPLGPVSCLFSALPKIGPAATASPTLLLLLLLRMYVRVHDSREWTLLIPQCVLLHRVRDSLLFALIFSSFSPLCSLFCRFHHLFPDFSPFSSAQLRERRARNDTTIKRLATPTSSAPTLSR